MAVLTVSDQNRQTETRTNFDLGLETTPRTHTCSRHTAPLCQLHLHLAHLSCTSTIKFVRPGTAFRILCFRFPVVHLSSSLPRTNRSLMSRSPCKARRQDPLPSCKFIIAHVLGAFPAIVLPTLTRSHLLSDVDVSCVDRVVRDRSGYKSLTDWLAGRRCGPPATVNLSALRKFCTERKRYLTALLVGVPLFNGATVNLAEIQEVRRRLPAKRDSLQAALSTFNTRGNMLMFDKSEGRADRSDGWLHRRSISRHCNKMVVTELLVTFPYFSLRFCHWIDR